MPNPPRLTLVLMLILVTLSACSRDEHPAGRAPDGEKAIAGNEAVADKVRAAVRALAQPQPSVDFVAAELAGVVTARTTSQTLMHYDGYRIVMTTPANSVTRITFELAEARPTMQQLTDLFGTPEEIRRGYLYESNVQTTGATIRILAEPASKPATEASLVRRVVVEGAPTR